MDIALAKVCGSKILVALAPFCRYTKCFEELIVNLCLLLFVAHVSELLNIDWKIVKEIAKLAPHCEFANSGYTNLRLLAIDELNNKTHYK